MGSAGVPPASGGILPPPETQATYGYSATTGRLETVSNGTSSFRYDYLANSSLIEHVVATAGAVHDVHLAYEPTRNVLASRQNKVGTTIVSGYDYSVVNEGVNSLGQRTGVKTTFNLGAGQSSNAGDTSWGYDALGQVVSAATPNSTADRAYQYDTIGNRKKTSNTLTLPGTDNWDVNPLNQYSAIPQAPTAPVFDFDGNMTSGPLPAAPTANSSLTWDAENRLIETTVGPNGPLVQNYYDSQSRRIATTSGGETTVYVYDGWNVASEYSISNSQFQISKSYLWGLDLSGTMQGAGGVGGLLSVTSHSALLTSHFPSFDGNGNVSEYVNSSGEVVAHFEYDPFGNTVVNTDIANQFAYRFSTKPQDSTTGLCYYGYRFYDPLTGRWPSRDPIEEEGGINIYTYSENDGISKVDVLGLISKKECRDFVDQAKQTQGYKDQVSFLNKKKCKIPDIKCSCCWLGTFRAEFSPKTGDIKICSNRVADTQTLYNSLKHEMIHAVQKCKGKLKGDCESRMCAEMEAYANSTCRKYKGQLYHDCIYNGVYQSTKNFCDWKKKPSEMDSLYKRLSKTCMKYDL